MRTLPHGAMSWFAPASTLVIGILLAMTSLVLSINVSLPDDFEQCMPAIIGLNQSKGNISIVIREQGVKKALVNVTLPVNTTSWTWPAVNASAGENITILVTDRSTKRKSSNELSIDSSLTNDTSCLPVASDTKKHKDDPSDQGSDGSDDGGSNDSQTSTRHKNKTTEVSVIAGVLGGLLFALISLVLIMCWRRRREARDHVQDESSKDTITAHRIGEMGERLDRHRVVTLFSEDGRAEGQAMLGREGDAGWSYMNRLAPGLQMTPPPSQSRSNQGRIGRRGPKTRRYDNESKDGELPSYGLSEYEEKALPKYATESGFTPLDGARVLTTRHDSQGSRLTFSSESLDPNGIFPTPRQSTATRSRGGIPPGGEDNDDEEVIVFRPMSGHPDDESNHRTEHRSIYSMASSGFTPMQAFEPASTLMQSHATGANQSGHRRSRSEVSFRRNYNDNSPFY
jgi:hypothetical protein